MEREHLQYNHILNTRQMTYVWRHPVGTPGNYKVRDPSVPQDSLCGLWHRERRTFLIDQQPVTEEYWER
jgi:hypothetical protein